MQYNDRSLSVKDVDICVRCGNSWHTHAKRCRETRWVRGRIVRCSYDRVQGRGFCKEHLDA